MCLILQQQSHWYSHLLTSTFSLSALSDDQATLGGSRLVALWRLQYFLLCFCLILFLLHQEIWLKGAGSTSLKYITFSKVLAHPPWLGYELKWHPILDLLAWNSTLLGRLERKCVYGNFSPLFQKHICEVAHWCWDEKFLTLELRGQAQILKNKPTP